MLSVTEMGGGFPVAHFNERNYFSWSLKIEVFLRRREDLRTVVNNPPADLNKKGQRQNETTSASIILCLEDRCVCGGG